MAIKQPTIGPFCYWRNGRPIFKPGPRERELGFDNEDLQNADSGAWFTLDEARAWCERRHGELVAARATGKRGKLPPAPRSKAIGDLLDAWLKSNAVTTLAGKTQRGYASDVRCIKWQPARPDAEPEREPFSLMPVSALFTVDPGQKTPKGRKIVKRFIEVSMKARGWTMALNMKATLSAAFTWALDDLDWDVPFNPCLKLKLARPKKQPPVTWTIPEWIAAARFGDHPAIDRPEMVDAIYLLLFTGQRPEEAAFFAGGSIVDVLDPNTGGTFKTVRLTQSKTGKLISVPAIALLTERLAAIARRKEAYGCDVAELVVMRRDRAREAKGAKFSAFTPDTLRDAFASFIADVAAGRPELGLPAMPSLADKRMKHLRKTLTTWLSDSGADLPAIASVTGHELQSLKVIGESYLYLGERQAKAAMALLETWLAKQGVAV